MLPADINIRPEQHGDEGRIHALTRRAFAGAKHSDGTEQDIIDRLRNSCKLACSLAACRGAQIVGHVAFSPIYIAGTQGAPAQWYGLGPVSVAPDQQRQGIGKALITQGLAILEKTGTAGGCVVLGDPAYYQKFGFVPSPKLTFPNAPAQYFMVQSFESDIPTGIVHYDAAFGV
ncbi:GNAT family N-acetyltransferase [Thalassospira sp. TSL5-1]|uniref:GNAT family N-acetyltransferase n=1 Tax=Thalassospira sp. TSL5-1 TaxID=1544451 RepID=UPI00093C5335|nr:N-acetyltransferase [Thalassospira sp. TSL5-1]OKH89443.1 hypothetical protein LF95_05540 [Thalassospira sp. TSL5-1]